MLQGDQNRLQTMLMLFCEFWQWNIGSGHFSLKSILYSGMQCYIHPSFAHPHPLPPRSWTPHAIRRNKKRGKLPPLSSEGAQNSLINSIQAQGKLKATIVWRRPPTHISRHLVLKLTWDCSNWIATFFFVHVKSNQTRGLQYEQNTARFFWNILKCFL